IWRRGVFYRDGLAARHRMVPAAIGRIPHASLGISASAGPVDGIVADQVHRRTVATVTGRWRREHGRVRTLNGVIGASRPNLWRRRIFYRDRLAARHRVVSTAIG